MSSSDALSSGADSAPFDAKQLEGQVLAERYRVESLLGEGGMGAVYRARHMLMHKTMALKVLHPAMTQVPEAVARFEREAVAASHIEHPNVAAATDFGRLPDGSFFLVLEFVEGKSLRSVLEEEHAFGAMKTIHIGRQIASALNAAHALGIVHRDLKPENVMLTEREDESDFVKVLDFGIAKLTHDLAKDRPALTRAGSVFGTPEYMSPEQAIGQGVDPRSDVYSLGVMLYEMVAGSRPFNASEPMAVLALHLQFPPPALPDRVPHVLADLIFRMLTKNPEARTQTATDVMREMDAVAENLNSSSSLGASGGQAVLAPSIVSSPSSDAESVRSLSPSASHPVVQAESWRSSASRARDNALLLLAKIRPLLRRPIRIRTTRVPVWVILAAVLSFLVTVLFVIWIVPVPSAVEPATSAAPAAADAAPEPTSSAPVLRPESEPSAISEAELQRLEAIAVYKRSLQDWLNLARGYASVRRYRESVFAYRAALQKGRASRTDPQMLVDLRDAAQSADAFSLVVNLCEGRRSGLGESGLDLLWDVWVGFRSQSDRQAQAEATLKKLHILSRRASPSLRIAIELQVSDNCDAISGLLERAAKYADERAVPRLTQIEQGTGCGNTECFRCLQGSQELKSAIAKAQSRTAPKIERGYRQ